MKIISSRAFSGIVIIVVVIIIFILSGRKTVRVVRVLSALIIKSQ